jgi:hypothetical protein
MVTRLSSDRTQAVRSAVAAFQAQTHQSRELVVVIDPSAHAAGRAELETVIRASGPAPIRVVEMPGTPPLGALRNRAIAEAHGDFVCQWDDDDIYHPERLSAQLAALREGGHEALLLQDVLQFFPGRRMLYWTNWRATAAGGHPGALFMHSGVPVRYPETGPEARLGEDTALAVQLRGRARLGALAGQPHLFAYVSHGANSWDDGHHRMLAETLAISKGLLVRKEAELRAGIAALDLGRGGISVCGSNGPAFGIEATGED